MPERRSGSGIGIGSPLRLRHRLRIAAPVPAPAPAQPSDPGVGLRKPQGERGCGIAGPAGCGVGFNASHRSSLRDLGAKYHHGSRHFGVTMVRHSLEEAGK